MWSRGTTIREVLALIAVMGLGMGAMLEGHRRWGGLGAAAGFVAGALAIPVGLVVYGWITRRVWPEWPRCAKGRCGGWEYRLTRHVVYEDGAGNAQMEKWAGMYRCGCGDAYAQVGRRLMRVAGDGSWEPFMKRGSTEDPRRLLGGTGRWVRDEGEAVRPRVKWEYGRGKGWVRVGG